MEDETLSQEIIRLIKTNLKNYAEWVKPNPADPLALTIVKSFFKGLTALLLVVFSPVVLLLLIVAFFAAF